MLQGYSPGRNGELLMSALQGEMRKFGSRPVTSQEKPGRAWARWLVSEMAELRCQSRATRCPTLNTRGSKTHQTSLKRTTSETDPGAFPSTLWPDKMARRQAPSLGARRGGIGERPLQGTTRSKCCSARPGGKHFSPAAHTHRYQKTCLTTMCSSQRVCVILARGQS